MNTELSSKYDPSSVEAQAYQVWMEEKCFAADPAAAGEPYCIVIPPPNVTGALHLGHAINATLQDILIRAHRMMGFNALWVPGIDHAGIATQAVVEKQLKEQENKTRHDVGREGLVERIWKWKQQYGDRILEQLKRLGASCDWDRTRFTLDDMCAKAVRETFFKLFKDGLIYRGKRLVNWDTFLQTSISDDEIYHETVKTFLWHIRYPIEMESAPTVHAGASDPVGFAPRTASLDDQEMVRGANPATSNDMDFVGSASADAGSSSSPNASAKADPTPGANASSHPTFMVVATTRPETMLGDTAVAVHSEDPRWNWAIGKHIRLPLTNRLIPIIADDILVDPKFGTGVVKVTPAHDPNDYAVWQRHKGQPDEIDLINILTPDGKITSDRPEWSKYAGLKRAAARTQVVDDLKAAGLLEKEEPYETQVGHSDRSKTPVEPYLSDQWFVKMAPLAEPALAAVREGKIKFHPERHAQQYLSWLGEKRDWPVSRQLWWGHRIPVWHKRFESATFGVKGRPGWSEADDSRLSGLGVAVITQTGAWAPVPWDQDVLFHMPDSDEADHSIDIFICVVGNDERSEAFKKELELKGYIQDPDVLDTWFSSALWPHSTLGWPEKTADLATYYPTSVLLTGRDIITLWVARMVMMGMYNMGDKQAIAALAPSPGTPGEGGGEGLPPDQQKSPHPNPLPAYQERGHKTPDATPNLAGSASRTIPESVRSADPTGNPLTASPLTPSPGTPGEGGGEGLPSDQQKCPHPNPLPAYQERGHKTPDATPNLAGSASRTIPESVRSADPTGNPLTASPLTPSPGTPGEGRGEGLPSDQQKSTHPNPLPAYRAREPEGSLHRVTPSPSHPVTEHGSRRPEARALGLPFLDVAINPTILDGKGERMSKSKGNGVDPVDIIDSYGADALRFTLTKMATETQDARMPVKRDANGKNTSDKFDEGRNFCNKLWNACRFALSNLEAVGSASRTVSSSTSDAVVDADAASLKPSSPGKSSDEDLMLRAQQGDKLSFVQLYERYSDSVLSSLYRMLGNVEDIESLAQEVFLRAFRFAATYQLSDKFSTWLFTITRNVAINQTGRRTGSPIRNVPEMNVEHIDMSGDPHEIAARAAEDPERQEEIARVLKALDALPTVPPGASAKADPTYTLVDRWIIARFIRTLAVCDEAIKTYRFDVYAKSCYDFFWGDFCDWYVEAIKPAMKDPARSGQTAEVLAAVLDGSLRLMHPMIPFITETVWWRLNDVRPQRGIPGRIECPPSKRLVLATWPTAMPTADSAEADFAKLQALISAIRTIRNDYQVNPKTTVDVYLKATPETSGNVLADRELIEMLATCTLKEVRADLQSIENAVTAGAAGCDIFVTGLIDPNAEKARLTKEIESREKSISAMKTRLSNEAYIAKAPLHLVQQSRDQLAAAEAELAKLEESLKKLA